MCLLNKNNTIFLQNVKFGNFFSRWEFRISMKKKTSKIFQFYSSMIKKNTKIYTQK